MRSRTATYAVALLAVPVTIASGCAATSGAAVTAGGSRIGLAAGGPAAARAVLGGYPTRFVAAVNSGRRAGSGLAMFSSAGGRLERWLVPDVQGLRPIAVGPGGRWVYYVNVTSGGSCAGNGYTQPALWRVLAGGGRPRQAGLRTSGIAFSPDGRMSAYVWTAHCGRAVWIVVRDRRAGTSRRIFVTRNARGASYPVTTAELSWSPDDRHLAVSYWSTTAVSKLFVVNARTASALPAAAIRPCAGHVVGCKDASFTAAGALIFLKWRLGSGPPAERILRWQHGRATVLLGLRAAQNAIPGSVAADQAGRAVLVEGGYQRPAIWRWVSGRTVLLLRSTAGRAVTRPLWLPEH